MTDTTKTKILSYGEVVGFVTYSASIIFLFAVAWYGIQ